jgi:hypothetical protein
MDFPAKGLDAFTTNTDERRPETVTAEKLLETLKKLQDSCDEQCIVATKRLDGTYEVYELSGVFSSALVRGLRAAEKRRSGLD